MVDKALGIVFPVAFWLIVWQVASMAIAQEVLLVSPVAVVMRLTDLVQTVDFWGSIAASLSRIAVGFLLAMVLGTLLAALSSRFQWVRRLLAPLVQAVKAVPVASFVILVLIWVSSSNLSIVISFLMVFPLVYANVLEGIRQVDPQLLEMAQVFDLSPLARLRYLYCSQVLPYFQAASSLALGMCWKAGIAAEVIGLPSFSIGERLYDAKVYLNTPDLFAWTVVIVLISLVFERSFAKLLARAVTKMEEMR